MTKKIDLLYEVRRERTLWRAWRHVRESGMSSESREIRNKIENFDEDAHRRIRKIQERLRKGGFLFSPSMGYPKARPGKRPRPIVVSEIGDRVVQRALLDVLKDAPGIKSYVNVETSFGGLEDRGVRSGVEAALKAIDGGCRYYARSDIKDFFQAIPKEVVLEVVEKRVENVEFVDLLRRALTVELANLDALGQDASLFPIFELGVAQGCCLSPLVGNILLHEFDVKLNTQGLRCLRYIDDFLILGAGESDVERGVEEAINLLKHLGLTAYRPVGGQSKAAMGPVEEGFTFLGCEIKNGLVHPDRQSRKRLINKLKSTMRASASAFRSGKETNLADRNLTRTLMLLNGIVRGWGNQYSFCYDMRLWRNLDREIDKLLKSYLGQYRAAREKVLEADDGDSQARRLLGVHLLEDSRDDPVTKDLKNLRSSRKAAKISRRTWVDKE